jgi:hypothetical protein
VLTLNGFDRLLPVYPDLDGAFAVGAEHREQGARTADPAAQAEELLNVAVGGISSAGLTLQAAVDLPPDVTVQRINEALRRLDDVVQEIRTHLLTDRGAGNEPDAARKLPPHILERSTQAKHRSEFLQKHVARTARAVQSAAADTAALMEQRADLVRLGRIDYPTDIKRWRALADQARQLAECWEQP